MAVQMQLGDVVDEALPVEQLEDLERLVQHTVIGPPGCGKTTWLARQAQLAAAKHGRERVAICSLTKAAAVEVAGRDTGIPEQNVGTLHAHAFRALDRPPIAETTQGVKLWNAWVPEHAWRLSGKNLRNPEVGGDEMPTFDAEGDELLGEIGVLRALDIAPAHYPPAIRSFHERWEAFKVEHGLMDFTDLIVNARDTIGRMPCDPAVLFVDEAQDMSTIEIQLLRQWGRHADMLIVVGDPDQALYTWRGADPDGVFGHDAASVRVLSQSYRVPAAVHEKAVGWIRGMPGRIDVDYEPTDREGSVVKGSVEWKDPLMLLDTLIADLALYEGSETSDRVMVLASCAYMLQPLCAVLRDAGIPFHNPYRSDHGGWNPLNGGRRLLAFLRPHLTNEMWTWRDVAAWSEFLRADETFVRGAKKTIKGMQTSSRFGEGGRDTEARLDDVLRLLADDEGRNALMDGDLDWYERHLIHRHARGQQFSLTVARTKGAAALRERPTLVVGSIHSVKGAEADSVYLWPDLSTQGYYGGWKTDGEARDSVYRQFYVAMTRARDKLTLLPAASNCAVDL